MIAAALLSALRRRPATIGRPTPRRRRSSPAPGAGVERAAVRSRVVGAVRRSHARRLDRARAHGRSRSCGSPPRASKKRARCCGAARRDRWPGVVGGSRAHGEHGSSSPVSRRSASRSRATTPVSRRSGSSTSSAACAAASRPPPRTPTRPIADLRDAQVLVAAEVARNYLELRGAQKRLAVARANLRLSARDARPHARAARARPRQRARRRERGRAPRRDRGDDPAARRRARRSRRIGSRCCSGERPGALDAELAPREIAPHLTTLAVDSPAALLQRRPDIRAAERELAAATARIGVAKADLFPRLTLSGFIGFIAGDAGELGESTSRAWSLSPVLSWAGFERGVRARSSRPKRAPQARSRRTSSRCCARSRRPRTRS